ncbi:LysR family transcriptional regulator [Histidinibacterium lentulum]|uniref:LysR family transcriptional regulator n=1 Tax=Histidinibacterium lentulum TaxID=2480588 RepID=A0A3N2QRJ1_9RHOB|nr:LysR family transcriptional regulator [Histidinibacterium lentulum]ROT97823.1 LysR family transcriptional regulator [Histidinibacterium lentulum]
MIRTSLVYFDQAIRDGSIRRAAESLNVASSAVNRQLLKLEEELGVALFERLPRGIRPTAAGELLLGYVRRWRRESGALGQELAALRGGIRGTIRVAAAESITEDVLPNAVRELNARYPLVEFSVISGDNLRITSELFSKDADVVVAFDKHDDVRGEVLHTISSPLGVIMPPDHPLARLPEVTLAHCTGCPMVVPGAEWLQHSGLNTLFSSGRFPARIVARAERPGMLKAMVRSGIGVALLTQLGVERDVARGDLAWRPLATGQMPPARIYLMVPRHRVPPVSTLVFIDILKTRLDACGSRSSPSSAPG